MKEIMRYKFKFDRKIILIFLLNFCVLLKTQGQLQVSQCAINYIKGLDSLLSPAPTAAYCKVTPCSSGYGTLKEWRTILNPNCSGVTLSTSNTFVFTAIWKYNTNEFRLSWPTSNTYPADFGQGGICLPCSLYFSNTTSSGNNNYFPFGSYTASNFVDAVRIKKIVGISLVNENVHNIKSIKNPRLMTPLDPFWPLVNPAMYNHVMAAAGILVDITLKDDTKYVGMLWHYYSPEYVSSNGAWMMDWKEVITCPPNMITGFSASDLGTSPGPCNKYQLSVNLSGAVACPNINGSTIVFDHGDGSPPVVYTCATNGNYTDTYIYTSPGTYKASAIVYGPGTCSQTLSAVVNITCPPPCIDCIPSFAPIPEHTYVISAWVKENGTPQSTTTYTKPKITVVYTPSSTNPSFLPTGDIIDGWQRIEGKFKIPLGTTNLDLKLECIGGNCYYDDVRVFPFDGSMKSYVYDPVNMRLVAELDERHYATLYEYDEEGKLIRVKKETEKGKMTIQENRNNTKK